MKYTDALRREYAELWATMDIKPGRQALLADVAQKVFEKKARYQAVAEITGVPWWWIGLTHRLEAGGRFDRHLHNGDPLTKRTRHVPKGMPKSGKPPFAWEESAVDALRSHDLHKVEEWTLPRAAYEFERFNGFGYRRPGRPVSPYLWSMCDHYSKGKYVADGKYSSTAVSGQCGTMPVLKELMKLDPEIAPDADGLKDEENFPKASVPASSEPPTTMLNSNEGNAAVTVTTVSAGAASVEIANAMATASADGKWSVGEFALAIVSSPWFWSMALVAGAGVYIWLRRRARLIQWGV